MSIGRSVQCHLRLVLMVAVVIGGLVFVLAQFRGAEESYAVDGTDYTEDIQAVGNVDSGKPAYARNVWDMQEYDGKVYIGHGNSSNASATAVNAGPIPIVALNPQNNVFTTEYMIDGEEVSRLNVLGDSLYVPDDDPRTGGWNLGNLYVKSPDANWVMKRTIPGGIHNFDVAEYDNKLWVALGVDTQYAGATAIQYSENGGSTWNMGLATKTAGRVYSLVNTGGSLYGISDLSMYYSGQLRLNGCKITAGQDLPQGCDDLLSTTSVQGTSPMGSAIIKNKFDFDGKLVFNTIAGGTGGTYDDIHNPGLVYYTDSFPNGLTQLNLPDASAQPLDMIQKDGAVYILAFIENSTTSFTNIVYRTTDLSTVTEVLRFNYGSFARSFEKLSGQDEFVFGIGARNVASPSALAGNIIRISLDGAVVAVPNNVADLAFVSAAASFANPLTGTTGYTNPAVQPAFSSDQTSYTFTVEYRFSKISLGRGVSSAGATATTQSGVSLNQGNNALTLTVTARDGVTKKTYNINVVRSAPSTVNTLAALSVTGAGGSPTYALSPNFAAGTLAYAVAVPEEVSAINIAARATSSTLAPVSSPDTDAPMTTTYSSSVTTNGTVSNLEKGVPKTVRVVVTSESGVDRTYTLTITRAGAPVTPVKVTPTVAQLSYSIPTDVVYAAAPRPIVAPVPKSGVTGLGGITVRYAGAGGTTYAESATAPTNAGSYTVYADVAEGVEYTAAKLNLGTYQIAKADQAIEFTCPASGYVGDVINLTAAVSTGLAGVVFQSQDTDVAVVSGSVLTLAGVGTATITAAHPGSVNYNAISGACDIASAERLVPDYGVVRGFADFDGTGYRVAIINAEVADFVQLTLDGEVVRRDDYAVTEGSTVITLDEEYLMTLAAGKHAFMAEFADDVAVPLSLTILAAEEVTGDDEMADDGGVDAPVTGMVGMIVDGGPLSLGIVTFLVAGMAVIVRWCYGRAVKARGGS